MQNEAAQYLDFIDEDEQRRRQAKRILFALLIGLALIGRELWVLFSRSQGDAHHKIGLLCEAKPRKTFTFSP